MRDVEVLRAKTSHRNTRDDRIASFKVHSSSHLCAIAKRASAFEKGTVLIRGRQHGLFVAVKEARVTDGDAKVKYRMADKPKRTKILESVVLARGFGSNNSFPTIYS